MPHGRSRIALIERPVDQAIEEHCRGPGKDHAGYDQEANSEGRPAAGGYEERAESEGQGKNGVGEANQPQKARDGSSGRRGRFDRALILFHGRSRTGVQ